MPVYLAYSTKVSICLALVFLFYNLLLKRMTYYTWNRYFLLFFSMLSFIVPFINIGTYLQEQPGSTISLINQIPSINTARITSTALKLEYPFTYSQITVALFVLVSSGLAVRLLIQLLSIQHIKSTAKLLTSDEEKIYHLSQPILPFSFLNSIFINTNNYAEHELQKIIDHERVHVQQKHSIDVLITEAIFILNWYNPFAWLLKKAVRENLEFIADHAVISKGVDRKNYQYLLLKVTGDLPSSITSSFKLSSLKKRILMMNKNRTSRLHLLKFVLLVPMITLLLVAFRNSKEHKLNKATVQNQSIESYTLNKLTYSIPNEKVKAIVLKENGKSLLKTGDILNLSQIFHEKDRLKVLLESNGYGNLKKNAIIFMIDTASVNNSFSVEIKIDVEPASVFIRRQKPIPLESKMIASNFSHLFPGGQVLKRGFNKDNTIRLEENNQVLI